MNDDDLPEGRRSDCPIFDENVETIQSIVLIGRNGNAAEYAKVTRCKDCKHQVKEWRTDKRLKDNGYMVCGCDVVGDACGYWALLGQDEDFCSMAEPKETNR